MQDYWNGFFMGFLLGAAAGIIYLSSPAQVKDSGQRVRAQVRKMGNALEEAGREVSKRVTRQA